MRESLKETMKAAHEHAAALQAERANRGGACLHEDALRRQNARMLEQTEENKRMIAEIRTIFGRLQNEMDIATHRLNA